MPNPSDKPYQVLARKYRSQTFAELIGQDAMVRILSNSFKADKVAHAFILTGVRGVGKTSTARIVAKGLNCSGPDGKGGPTIEPCGQCRNCLEIAEGRHIDVLEMDAASRTGVNDIRDIIDGVPYRPAGCRYKVYIIDEIHMLSSNAFNALLKTLEEPPSHVKFIFATTEIKAVPVTVLSRCQRFDLRRVEPDVMSRHLRKIAKQEGIEIADEALALIIRAAEGSVRDAVSLLDQAAANGTGSISPQQVREMLALADRGRILDLFDLVMKGDAAGALHELASQYSEGADPLAILRELAEVTHWVSVVKYSPEAADDPAVGPDERDRGRDMSSKLPMSVLARSWQMLLRSISEASIAPNAMAAAEMAIIRLACVSDMPTPESLVKRLESAGESGPAKTGAAIGQASGASQGPPAAQPGGSQINSDASRAIQSFDELRNALEQQRDFLLLEEIERYLRIVEFESGRIRTALAGEPSKGLVRRLKKALQDLTGLEWIVEIAESGGAQTANERKASAERSLLEEVKSHRLTRSALDAFPNAKIRLIETPAMGDPNDNRIQAGR